MPQPILYQADRGLINGINQATNAISQALENRNEQARIKQKEEEAKQQYRQSGNMLQQILQALPQNATVEQYQGVLAQAIQAGIPLEVIKQVSDLYKPVLEQREKAAQSQNYLASVLNRGSFSTNPQLQSGPQFPVAPPSQEGQSLPIDTPYPMGANGGQVPNQMENQNPFNFSNLSQDQIGQLLLSPYKQHQDLANAAISQQKQENDRFIADRKYHAKGAEKAEDEANSLRRSIRSKEGALRLSREAIETGETGPLSWANIAKRLDVPELMNAAGTELTQAGKEFFFGNMQKVSAKAQNQWLEQRITKLAAEVGDPRISALMKQTMLEGELALDKAYLEAYDRLKSEDMQKDELVKNDIEARAFKASEAQANKILDEVSYKTRQLYEEEKGIKWLADHALQKVPNGTSS